MRVPAPQFLPLLLLLLNNPMKKSDLTRRANNVSGSVHSCGQDFVNGFLDGYEAGYSAALADLRRTLGGDIKAAANGSAHLFRIGLAVRKWLRPIR